MLLSPTCNGRLPSRQPPHLATLNPKVTWTMETVLAYFQSEFEGISRTLLDRFNKDRLYKPARSIQQHQKQQIWGWYVIYMKLESLDCPATPSFSLPRALVSYMVHMYSKFVGRRPSRSKWLKKFLMLHLLWVVLWPLGFAYLSLHKISQNYLKNALMFLVSDNPMYTTSITTNFCGFCIFFKWRGELVCGAQIS